MTICYIVAVAENNAIGKNNQLPWRLPEDLKFFKRTTMGKPVLMGRKTYESLGKPLPGRLNIVVSANTDLQLPEGVLLFTNLDAAVERLQAENTDEGFIIGGGTLFEQCLPLTERMYITRVQTTIADADAFFVDIDHTHWKKIWMEEHTADEKHAYNYTFEQYERLEI